MLMETQDERAVGEVSFALFYRRALQVMRYAGADTRFFIAKRLRIKRKEC